MIISTAAQKKIDRLEERQHSLDRERERIDRLIEQIKVLESPIKVGDTIEWVSGCQQKVGKVKAISGGSYRGYEYRVLRMNKAGKVIGIATVTEDHQPTLFSRKRK